MTRTLLTGFLLAGFLLFPTFAQANIPKSTRIAKIVVTVHARSAPSAHARTVMTLKTTAPLYRGRHVLAVVDSKMISGHEWVGLLLPKRPNEYVGWVPADQVVLSNDTWYVDVSINKRTVTAYRNGKRVKSGKAVVGKASTPTPRGKFAVHEIVPQPRGGVLGPDVLALVAFSNVLKQFGGGPGQIGLHGRSGSLLSDPLGSARSHGCIRVDNKFVSWLASHIGPGTVVNVHN